MRPWSWSLQEHRLRQLGEGRLELSFLTAVAQGHQLRGAPRTKGTPDSRSESTAPCPAVSPGPQRPAIWLGRGVSAVARAHKGLGLSVG